MIVEPKSLTKSAQGGNARNKMLKARRMKSINDMAKSQRNRNNSVKKDWQDDLKAHDEFMNDEIMKKAILCLDEWYDFHVRIADEIDEFIKGLKRRCLEENEELISELLDWGYDLSEIDKGLIICAQPVYAGKNFMDTVESIYNSTERIVFKGVYH